MSIELAQNIELSSIVSIGWLLILWTIKQVAHKERTHSTFDYRLKKVNSFLPQEFLLLLLFQFCIFLASKICFSQVSIFCNRLCFGGQVYASTQVSARTFVINSQHCLYLPNPSTPLSIWASTTTRSNTTTIISYPFRCPHMPIQCLFKWQANWAIQHRSHHPTSELILAFDYLQPLVPILLTNNITFFMKITHKFH